MAIADHLGSTYIINANGQMTRPQTHSIGYLRKKSFKYKSFILQSISAIKMRVRDGVGITRQPPRGGPVPWAARAPPVFASEEAKARIITPFLVHGLFHPCRIWANSPWTRKSLGFDPVGSTSVVSRALFFLHHRSVQPTNSPAKHDCSG